MSLILHSKKDTLVVCVLGDLDLVSADEIRKKIDNSLAETRVRNLFLDLSKTTFMDSSGLGVILGRYRQIKEGQGRMIIYGIKEGLRKVLEISGILSLMPVCDTEKEAWELLDTKRGRGA